MEMKVDQKMGSVAVTTLAVVGSLDGSNYESLIQKAKDLFDGDTERLVLDMSGCEFVSSAGLIALHSIALISAGEEPSDLQRGWAAFHAMGKESDEATQATFKIAGLKDGVKRTLEKTGLLAFFEVYDNVDDAVADF